MRRAAAIVTVAATALALAALHPRAAVVALVVSAGVALVAHRGAALVVCLVLLVAAAFGIRVDAAPPSDVTSVSRR